MTESEFFGYIRQLIIPSLSGALSAILFIKFIGKQWIANKFAKDLEFFKTQKLHEFDLLLTRKAKWHEAEHEVLSMSWRKLILAHIALKQAISMLRHLPDLDRMESNELEIFLAKGDFCDDEKVYLRNSKGKISAYSHILDVRALTKAQKEFQEFHTYYDENRIFLRPHIKEKFERVDDYIWSAWVFRKMSVDCSDGERDSLREAYDLEDKKIRPLIKDIESIIQSELFPDSHRDDTVVKKR